MTKTCTTDDFQHSKCECFSDAGWIELSLGLGMVLGNFILFAQMEKIRRRGTTLGVSGWMVALHCAFNTFAALNYLGLSWYQLVPCCQHGSSWFCFGTLLPAIAQAEVLVIVHIIFGTFALYHDPTPELSMAKFGKIAAAAVSVEVLAISIFIYFAQMHGVYSAEFQAYCTACAAISCLLAAVQWAPQIWVTSKLGRVGTLSVLMITVQSIGGVAATINVVLHATTWLSWLTAAFNTFMCTLLMLVLFRIWVAKQRGLSFMFSFMLSADRQAELEEEILREIEAEEAAELEAGSSPTGQSTLIEGRQSSVQLNSAEKQLSEQPPSKRAQSQTLLQGEGDGQSSDRESADGGRSSAATWA